MGSNFGQLRVKPAHTRAVATGQTPLTCGFAQMVWWPRLRNPSIFISFPTQRTISYKLSGDPKECATRESSSLSTVARK